MKKREVCELLDELWLSVHGIADDIQVTIDDDTTIRNQDFKDGVRLGIRLASQMAKMEINQRKREVLA